MGLQEDDDEALKAIKKEAAPEGLF